MNVSRVAAAACAVASVAAADPAGASPWTLQPTLSLRTEWQSNPQLDTTVDRAGSGTLARLELPFENDDGRTRWTFAPRANAGTSNGAAGLGTDDRSLDAGWLRRDERGATSIVAAAARTSLFGPDAADLGVVRPNGRRLGQSLVAVREHGLGPRSTLVARASGERVRYRSDDRSTRYTDYRYASALAQYGLRLTPRTEWLVVASAGRYAAIDGSRRTGTWNVATGARLAVREDLVAAATVGDDSYDVSLQWDGPRSAARLAARQALEASGLGDLTTRRSFEARYEWRATERLRVSLDAAASRDSVELPGSGRELRDYRSAAVTATWELSASWRLAARVDHAYAGFPATSSRSVAASADSTGAALTLTRAFGPTLLN